MTTLLCSSKTNPKALAKKVEKYVDEETVKIEVVGAGAVNQAIKSVCYVNENRRNKDKVTILPKFEELTTKDGKEQIAVILEVF